MVLLEEVLVLTPYVVLYATVGGGEGCAPSGALHMCDIYNSDWTRTYVRSFIPFRWLKKQI